MLQRIEIWLNTSLVSDQPVVIYAYGKGNGLVPSLNQMYGQTREELVVQSNQGIYFDMKRSEYRALDKPTQRCDESGSKKSVSECAGLIFDGFFNCSPRFLMSNPSLKTCSPEDWSKMNKSELNQIIKIVKQMEEYVYNRKFATHDFCMPSCTRLQAVTHKISQNTCIRL